MSIDTSSAKAQHNKSLETDCKGRAFLSPDLLAKVIQFQLCATRGLTGMACIPRNVLRLEQLMGWHKVKLAYSLAAAQFQRYVAPINNNYKCDVDN